MTAPLHASLLADVLDQIDYRWKSVFDISREDVEDCDIVLHFAAQPDVPMGFSSPRWTIYNNVMGTTAVLEACRDVKRIEKVLVASSGNAVQRPLYLPIDEKHPPNAVNPYGASKACQEIIAFAYHRAYNIPVVVYRNGVIVGKGMRREIFIFRWLYNILQNKPIIVEGYPIADQTRDITHVSDTLAAWLLGIEAKPEKVVGELFQISYGQELSVEEIAKLCMKVCGREVPIIRKPHRAGEKGMRELFDTSKARKILGYDPKIPPEKTIQLTKEWIETEIL